MKKNLYTLKEWKLLNPHAQGYILYMEADIPGSELKGVECPYEVGTKQREKFDRGEMQAVLLAQDSEE